MALFDGKKFLDVLDPANVDCNAEWYQSSMHWTMICVEFELYICILIWVHDSKEGVYRRLLSYFGGRDSIV